MKFLDAPIESGLNTELSTTLELFPQMRKQWRLLYPEIGDLRTTLNAAQVLTFTGFSVHEIGKSVNVFEFEAPVAELAPGHPLRIAHQSNEV